jgi:amphi-Trp domain-containing protein
MPEEVLFADERRKDRAEIAAYLRTVADKLESGEAITFASGDSSVTVDPPTRPTFEVKVEHETARGTSAGELSIELELEWDEADESTGDGSLTIE